MKLCEKCGKEYDDSAELSCPYCAASADSDIVSGDFPAFVPDVMNYAGDVTVERESFRENRVAIYRRNQIIAAKQNIINAKDEYIRVHLPERKKSTVIQNERTVYRVKPVNQASRPPAPAKKAKTVNKFAYGFIGFAMLIAGFIIAVSVIDSDNPAAHKYDAQKVSVSKNTADTKPSLDANSPLAFLIEKDGLTIELFEQETEYNAMTYEYVFRFRNSSNADVINFPYIFTGAENADKINKMISFYPDGEVGRTSWEGGVPTGSPIIYQYEGKYVVSSGDAVPAVKPGESVTGYIY